MTNIVSTVPTTPTTVQAKAPPLSATPIDVSATLRGPVFGHDEIRRMLSSIAGPASGEFRRTVEAMQTEVASNPSLKVRVGIGLFYLGKPDQAADTLSDSKDGLGRFYAGQAY